MTSPATMTESPTAVDATLVRADSGTMPLAELLSCTQQLNQGGLAEASARLYERWIAATDSPLRHVACFNWGTVLAMLSRHAEAEQAYRQALGFQPDFAQARLNLGHQLERSGRADEALAEWQQALDRVTGDDDAALGLRKHALNNRARLLEKLRRYDEAEAALHRSLLLDPAQPRRDPALRAPAPEAVPLAAVPGLRRRDPERAGDRHLGARDDERQRRPPRCSC